MNLPSGSVTKTTFSSWWGALSSVLTASSASATVAPRITHT